MKKYRSHKIWLNRSCTKYCTVKVYLHKSDMRACYKRYCVQIGQFKHAEDRVLGASLHWISTNKELTGEVLLYRDCCGASIVAHEFMHAVLWARGHKSTKQQYPIVIKRMQDEEKILHDLSYALSQFYRWFYQTFEQHG